MDRMVEVDGLERPSWTSRLGRLLDLMASKNSSSSSVSASSWESVQEWWGVEGLGNAARDDEGYLVTILRLAGVMAVQPRQRSRPPNTFFFLVQWFSYSHDGHDESIIRHKKSSIRVSLSSNGARSQIQQKGYVMY
jgi:hypothetical protein